MSDLLLGYDPSATLNLPMDTAEPSLESLAERPSGSLFGDSGLFSDNGDHVEPDDLKDQFIIFQMNPRLDGKTILDAAEVEPALDGSDDKPDVKAVLNLESFHVGGNENVDPNTRATMRLTMGGDSSQSTSLLDTGLWTAAAGIKLYDDIKNNRVQPKQAQTSFHEAFNRRPIEVPGGLASLHFEIIKHRETPWWKKIFAFLQSDTVTVLTSALGFPAITQQAVGFVDELISRIDEDSGAEVLFKSRAMRFAMTKTAKDEYTGGSPRIRIGALNRGFMIMARGRDYETIADSNANYMAHYGRLVPEGVSEAELLNEAYDDPFKDVTYAVFKAKLKEAKVGPDSF